MSPLSLPPNHPMVGYFKPGMRLAASADDPASGYTVTRVDFDATDERGMGCVAVHFATNYN